MPRPERMTIPARKCIDVDALGLGSAVGSGRGRVPAVESRDSHQLAHAVAIEIGRANDPFQAVLGLRLGTHWADPAGTARASVEHPHAPKFDLRRNRARVKHDDLAATAAIELEQPGPFARAVVFMRQRVLGRDRRSPPFFSCGDV